MSPIGRNGLVIILGCAFLGLCFVLLSCSESESIDHGCTVATVARRVREVIGLSHPNVEQEHWVPKSKCMQACDKDLMAMYSEINSSSVVAPRLWGWTNHVLATLPTGELLTVNNVADMKQAYAFSDKLGVGYIHVHKAAGATFRFGSLSLARNWQAFRQQYITSQTLLNTMSALPFIFTYVRNPWSRMVSVYFFVQELSDRVSFEQFIVNPQIMQMVSTTDIVHYRAQIYCVLDSTGRILPDFIGRMEYLYYDFPVLLSAIGDPFVDKIVATKGLIKALHNPPNEERPRDWRDMFRDPETGQFDMFLVNQVRCHYEADIELFGYDFDLSEVAVKKRGSDLMHAHFNYDRLPDAKTDYVHVLEEYFQQKADPEAFLLGDTGFTTAIDVTQHWPPSFADLAEQNT